MWYNSLLPMRHLLSTRAQMTHKLTTNPALLMIENLPLFFLIIYNVLQIVLAEDLLYCMNISVLDHMSIWTIRVWS